MKRNPRGKAAGPPIPRGPQGASHPSAPAAIARFLFSCGYKTIGGTRAPQGWYRFDVTDRTTNEPRGTRWISVRSTGGYQIRSAAPED